MENTLNHHHLKFLQSIAAYNTGSCMLMITDTNIPTLLSIVALFNNITEYDITTYVHVQNYSHIKYLDLLRTLHVNPPMDMQTYVVKGDVVQTDLCIYDDSVMDIILLIFDGANCFDVSTIPLFWTKLKSNGCIIIKGIKHNDTETIHKLQTDFVKCIHIPQTIRIMFQLIEGTEDCLIIKKPCY